MADAYPIDEAEWSDRPAEVPSCVDFDPYGSDLDAHSAWENFGSLTLPQAYAKFCENPLNYQEDFMFMGGKAFAFYFPVIERHLFECTPTADDDCQSWIIGEGIMLQLKWPTASEILPLRHRLLRLAEHVLGKLDSLAPDDQARVTKAWMELKSTLESI
jgi:hypothetical protein